MEIIVREFKIIIIIHRFALKKIVDVQKSKNITKIKMFYNGGKSQPSPTLLDVPGTSSMSHFIRY